MISRAAGRICAEASAAVPAGARADEAAPEAVQAGGAVPVVPADAGAWARV
jgi:hypothetical protein